MLTLDLVYEVRLELRRRTPPQPATLFFDQQGNTLSYPEDFGLRECRTLGELRRLIETRWGWFNYGNSSYVFDFLRFTHRPLLSEMSSNSGPLAIGPNDDDHLLLSEFEGTIIIVKRVVI
jgi:hypothetical protein